MKVQFKALPSNSPSLFPEDIFSRIPENHPVRLVNEVVDKLDIGQLIKQYKGGGTTSFHPRMMIKVLFYAYLNDIYSCRRIEKALQENINFMWLSWISFSRSQYDQSFSWSPSEKCPGQCVRRSGKFGVATFRARQI